MAWFASSRELVPACPGNSPITGLTRTDNPYDAILAKAELLLTYAADNGMEVGETERRAIYNFRLTDKKDQSADTVDALYLAYTKLSRAVTPRTAESINETSLERNRGVQKYRKIALVLSLFVIPFSVLSFVSAAMSDKIGKEIDNGNSLILQLRDGLGPNFAGDKGKLNDYDVIMKTQQLSTTMRALHETGMQIRYTLFGLMPPTPPDPKPISPGLANIPETITKMIPDFQSLRQFGQTGRDLVAVIYGAISTCILPVFYALLGVCAKLLDNSSSRSEHEPTFNRKPIRRISWLPQLPVGSWVCSITSRLDNPPRYLRWQSRS
jgi:hypothetical protein